MHCCLMVITFSEQHRLDLFDGDLGGSEAVFGRMLLELVVLLERGHGEVDESCVRQFRSFLLVELTKKDAILLQTRCTSWLGLSFPELVSGFLNVALLLLGALGRAFGAGGDVLLDLVPPLRKLSEDMAWLLRVPSIISVVVVEGLLLSFEVEGAIG